MGDAVYRHRSYLEGRLGDTIASSAVTLIDDPLIPRGPGSRPFDGEGRKVGKIRVVGKGVLRSYLLDTYSARKLGLRPTGSASGGGGVPHSSTSNFYLAPGRVGPEGLLRGVKRGLFVTRMMGFGFDPTTGNFAVQLAKHWGAEVTAVDHGDKLPMLRELGADHVIDYTQQDFTRTGAGYDVIFDVVGRSPFGRSVRALRERGRYVLANFRVLSWLRGKWVGLTSDERVITGSSTRTSEELRTLCELVEAGALRPVLDRSFPLEEIVEAHRYVEAGHKQGGVAILVVPEDGADPS